MAGKVGENRGESTRFGAVGSGEAVADGNIDVGTRFVPVLPLLRGKRPPYRGLKGWRMTHRNPFTLTIRSARSLVAMKRQYSAESDFTKGRSARVRPGPWPGVHAGATMKIWILRAGDNR